VQHIPLLNIGGLCFTASKWRPLYKLRLRDQKQDRNLWTPREFVHLRFLRWPAVAGGGWSAGWGQRACSDRGDERRGR